MMLANGGVVGVVRHHDEMMPRVEAHLVGAVDAAGGDGVGDLLREQIDHLDRAVAVSRPDLVMPDRHHAVGPRGVVVSGRADESAQELRQHRIRRGVDDVDRFIGAVAEDVDADDRIDEADVEGLDFLSARQRDHRHGREVFVSSDRGTHRAEHRGSDSEC